MTRSRYRFFETEYPYFMTCTIVGWLPVFTRPEAVEIVYDSWRYAQRERGLKLFGYVILENHLHLIASAPDLSDVMQRFKSPEHAQRFLETFSAVCNHFRPRRHRLSAKRYRQIMSERFQEWREIARLAPTG